MAPSVPGSWLRPEVLLVAGLPRLFELPLFNLPVLPPGSVLDVVVLVAWVLLALSMSGGSTGNAAVRRKLSLRMDPGVGPEGGGGPGGGVLSGVAGAAFLRAGVTAGTLPAEGRSTWIWVLESLATLVGLERPVTNPPLSFTTFPLALSSSF